MKTVGQILSEARKNKGISLEESEAATRIRRKMLVALEESAWYKLPSTTFVKGLLKNYGEYLELDTGSLLAFFRREYEEPKPHKESRVERQSFPRLRFTPQLVAGFVVGMFVLVIGFYLYTQYRSFTAPPLLEVSEPKNAIKIENPDVNVVGRTYQDAVLKINGQQVQTSPGGTFSVAVSLATGLNILTITAENKFGQMSTEKRTVIVESKKGAGEVVSTLPLQLLINIGPGSANITVEVDGKKTFAGVLLAGSRKTFRAEERIRLITSNAGSTVVDIDGKRETLGREGEKVEREFREK